jgi:hypothetical protein
MTHPGGGQPRGRPGGRADPGLWPFSDRPRVVRAAPGPDHTARAADPVRGGARRHVVRRPAPGAAGSDEPGPHDGRAPPQHPGRLPAGDEEHRRSRAGRVKRSDFIRELRDAGCVLKRHGARDDIWTNPANGQIASVPPTPSRPTCCAPRSGSSSACRAPDPLRPRARRLLWLTSRKAKAVDDTVTLEKIATIRVGIDSRSRDNGRRRLNLRRSPKRLPAPCLPRGWRWPSPMRHVAALAPER